MTDWKVRKEKVVALYPIAKADKIEVAQIQGWCCVVKKGEFQVGDTGIYFPIDSILPEADARFEFMRDRKYRVKTIKLRGELSQGLLLPMTSFPEVKNKAEDADLADVLNVRHYQNYDADDSFQEKEPDSFFEKIRYRIKKWIYTKLYKKEKKGWPGFIRKSDETRVQNFPWVLERKGDLRFEISEKLDGSSAQFFVHKGKYGVCSRNLVVTKDPSHAFTVLGKEEGFEKKLKSLKRNLSIGGEVIGPKIQKNPYRLGKNKFYCYNVFDIDKREYLSAKERHEICQKLGILHVPVIKTVILNQEYKTLADIIKDADGKSTLADVKREGLVFKTDGFSFKAISNEWLLENE